MLLLVSRMSPGILATLYTRIRRRGRALLLDHPDLDRTIGRSLAKLDERMHRRGALREFDEAGTVQCQGFTFHFRPMDAPTARVMFLNGDYEPGTREAILSLLQTGGTFVDLGAHIGYFTVLAAGRVGASGHVYAFEPMDGTRAILVENLTVNHFADRVEVVGMAVHAREEPVRFLCTPTSESNGIATPNDILPTVEVPATSLDAFFGARSWPAVDVVKMDVEGAELAALEGMRELVERNPKIAIIFEYHLAQMAHAAVDADAILDLLRSYGFDRYEILFRDRTPLDLPRERSKLDAMARRANVNILCGRSSQ